MVTAGRCIVQAPSFRARFSFIQWPPFMWVITHKFDAVINAGSWR